MIVLVILEMTTIVRIDVTEVNGSVSYVVGFSGASSPPCQGLSRAECIKHHLILDEATIDSYFGETQVNAAKLLLVLAGLGQGSEFVIHLPLLQENGSSQDNSAQER